MSIVSISLVLDFGIVAICCSIPAACFAFVCVWVCGFFYLIFILYLLLLFFYSFIDLFIYFAFDVVVCSCLFGKPKKNQGRGLVDRKLVQALCLYPPPSPPPPSDILLLAKAALLFWFYGGFICGVWLCLLFLLHIKY